MKIQLDISGPAVGARPIRQAISRKKIARNTRLDFEGLEALAGQLGAEALKQSNLVAKERPPGRRMQLGRRMAWAVRYGYLARGRDLNPPVGF